MSYLCNVWCISCNCRVDFIFRHLVVVTSSCLAFYMLMVFVETLCWIALLIVLFPRKVRKEWGFKLKAASAGQMRLAWTTSTHANLTKTSQPGRKSMQNLKKNILCIISSLPTYKKRKKTIIKTFITYFQFKMIVPFFLTLLTFNACVKWIVRARIHNTNRES